MNDLKEVASRVLERNLQQVQLLDIDLLGVMTSGENFVGKFARKLVKVA
jgi:hypothetical protein